MIMVEDIKKHTEYTEAAYHEDIADLLYAELGGRQTLTATHHGVEIVTVREDDSKLREAIKQGVLRKGIGNLDLVCDYVIKAMQ
jgi:ribosomal protein L20A (L18A)